MSRVRCGKPDCIGEYLTINLTRDILGVSSTGYVIRTSCSDGPCALKRTQAMDEEPPDLAKLSHENVVELMHYWTEEKDLFLVMELMDGDLGLLMEETTRPGVSPFSLSVAVDMMLQIAKGMLHLHERGVSHPHLNCDNVLYKLRGVGDVIVKVGGFGCSRPADMESMNQDVLRFGLTCLEILTGDEIPSGGDMRSRVPETTPGVLRDCILRCLEAQPGFSEVVMSLLQARSFIMQTCRDEMVYSGEIAQAESRKSMTEAQLSSTFISNGGLREIFAVHELHSQLGGISASVPATLIFFHGFHKVAEEWRRTWMTRNNKLVWSQKWLPEDLGAENIRVLSVSCDANSNVSNNYNRFEMGKKLVQALVLSPKWKLGEIEESIILVGHSFGGVLIKSLVTEARHFVQNYAGQQEAVKCGKLLERLAKIVFYSVPHASTGLEFENYISECRKIVALQESSFLQSLEGDADFVADMIKLSVDFESVTPEKVKFLAFLEGKPISKDQVLVTEKSYEGSSRSWEWHKIDKDNHFEVCRPNSKEHAGYRVLLDHLQNHLNPPRGVTSSAADVLSTSLFGKRQDDDGSFKALFAWERPPEKRFRPREEGFSSNASVTPAVSEIPRADSNPTIAAASVPTTYQSTPPDVDSDTSSDQNREQDDVTDYEKGGVRFRENLRKYVTEYKPPRFKWKLWMGTYTTVHEARRACDCARFYTSPDKGAAFYFRDSPALFAELGPLTRPLASVSKDVKDKAFNVELKKRAKEVIRKLMHVQGNVESKQQLELGVMSDEIAKGGMASEQLLLLCVSAVEQKDAGTLERAVTALRQMSSIDGKPSERVTAYFLEAILRRAGGSMLQSDPSFSSASTTPAHDLPNSHEVQWTERRWSLHELTRFVDFTPYFRFGYTAANGAILEALEGMEQIHVVDFSTTHGIQWPSFIEALAERFEGPPHVFRLTLSGAAFPTAPHLPTSYEEVGLRLAKYARLKNVPFEFRVLNHDPLFGGQLTAGQLNLREGEALAVNFSLRLHYLADESITPVPPQVDFGAATHPLCPRDELLHLIRALNPAIVTLYEEDCDTTSPSVAQRVQQSFAYEWMSFDFLATFWPPGHAERQEYEQNVGRKIENIVACEGARRLERLESRRQWLRRMARLRFRAAPVGKEVVAQLQEIVEHHNTGWGMKCDDDDYTQSLLWKGNCLTFASAWIPAAP